MSDTLARCFVAASLALGAWLTPLGVSASPVLFDSLPAGEATEPPDPRSVPFVIEGARHVDGVVRVDASRSQGFSGGYREFVLFDDPGLAHAFQASLAGPWTMPSDEADTCFDTATSFPQRDGEDPRIIDWDAFSPERLTVQTGPGDSGPQVIPIRAEHWVADEGGRARIETTLFWFDLRTGGARLIKHVSNELALVAEPYPGVSVYAMRTGPDAADFFVRRSAALDVHARGALEHALFSARRGKGRKKRAFSLSALQTSIGTDTRLNVCTFQRVELGQRERTVGVARKTAEQKRLALGLLAEPAPETASVTVQVVLGIEQEPDAVPPGAAPVAAVATEHIAGATTRALVVTLGLGPRKSDQAPQASVSYRWADRARLTRF